MDYGLWTILHGSLAQSAEQGPLKPKVIGSIPIRPTNINFELRISDCKLKKSKIDNPKLLKGGIFDVRYS